MFSGKTVLITGGTGSFGKEAVKHILTFFKPKKVIVFSRGEYPQYLMAKEFPDNGVIPIRYFIGDVKDKDRLWRALEGVDYVIHAAAMKQVPTCEYNPFEAIRTNVLGAQNVIDAAIDRGVKKVIALSTDKACNPINLYGATKLCSDKLFTTANVYSGNKVTQFSVVRYGNVMASRGSVIPYFQELTAKGLPIPITDTRMTRFWITLPKAVGFVMECFMRMSGGEIFVPKLPSMYITDLAKAIAGDYCYMQSTGIRPGEKIHEVMISKDDARRTVELNSYYAILPDEWVKGGKVWIGNMECSDFVRRLPEDFEYSSGTNGAWISVKELRKLLEPGEVENVKEAQNG